MAIKIILFRETNPFFDSGASSNRYSGLIKGLLLNGCQVKLVVTGGICSKEEKICSGKPANLNGLQVTYSEHYMVDSTNKRRVHWYILGWYHRLISKFVLRKYFSEQADYIWITPNNLIASVFNNCYLHIKGKSLIELNEYNDIYKYHKLNSAQYKKAAKEDKNLQIALSHIDCLAVMTKTLINHYKQFTKPEALFVHLPMTVDGSRFKNVYTGNCAYRKPYIAYTGSMSNMKDGVDVLIKAFIKISEKYPDTSLYMAGYYSSDVEGQKSLVREHGLQDKVIFLGALSKDEVPALLCGAKVLALPRPDSHQARGGFPTKLGEYLSTGNPVCVTSVGEIPDYLIDKESAFVAKPGDVDSFAEALAEALADNEKAKQVALNGQKVAENVFSSTVQSTRLYNFLISNAK